MRWDYVTVVCVCFFPTLLRTFQRLCCGSNDISSIVYYCSDQQYDAFCAYSDRKIQKRRMISSLWLNFDLLLDEFKGLVAKLNICSSAHFENCLINRASLFKTKKHKLICLFLIYSLDYNTLLLWFCCFLVALQTYSFVCFNVIKTEYHICIFFYWIKLLFNV